MTTLPLVSIAIPAYNHAAFIEDCLASVCAQTYPELELVLIDDGSTDNTFEMARCFLEPYRSRFRRVVLERRENRGVSANSNACIEACNGEWVHLLGSDDVLFPNKVERIQQHIQQWACPNLALVHADCAYIDQYGKSVTRARMKSRPAPGPDFQAYHWLFLEKHSLFNPTIALHRSTYLSIGGFDRDLPLEDLDCWLRLSVRHAVARVPEVLACYRKHPGNSLRRRVRMLGALFRTYGKFLDSYPGRISDREIRVHFRRNVWRVWRRTRMERPWMIFPVIATMIRCWSQTPRSTDYLHFADLLNTMPNS